MRERQVQDRGHPAMSIPIAYILMELRTFLILCLLPNEIDWLADELARGRKWEEFLVG